MLWRLVSFNELKEQTEASEGGRILKPDGALIRQTGRQSSLFLTAGLVTHCTSNFYAVKCTV